MRIVSTWRHVLLFCLIVSGVGLAAGSRLAAQPGACLCDHVTFQVSALVGCKVTVCYSTAADPDINPTCEIRLPGSTKQVNCVDWMTLGVRDCNGNLRAFSYEGPTSIFNVPMTNGCCVDVHLTGDDSGCVVVSIVPASGREACPGCG